MRKKLIVGGIVCVLCLGGVVASATMKEYVKVNENSLNQEEKMMNELGKEENDPQINALSTDKVIDKEDIEKQVDIMKEFNPEINEEEYYEQLEQKEIERRSLYIGAVEAGVSVTDEEVQNVIDELKNNLSEDKEAYDQLMAYLAGRKITEEEYWQEIKPIYIRNLTIQKYLESMEEQALKDSQNSKKTEEEIREKADEQLIEDCIDKYEVSVE